MITLLIVVFIAVGVLGSVVMMFAKGMSWKTRLGGASWAFMGTLALAGLMHGGESSTTIAKTSESPAQGAQLIAQRSDTSICPEQTRTRLKRQAYIEVAGGENCEGIVHDAHGYGDIYWMREAAGSDLSACEELLQPALDKASAELKSRGHDGFCRRALAVRDGAPGTPGTKTVDELIATLRGNLADGERVIGVWFDDTKMNGFVAITTLGGAIYHRSIYPDGSIEAVNRWHVLVPTTPKFGGLRAWETPGLKRRTLKTLGIKTTEFMTKDGERWDYYRYEEGKDRRLRAWQLGVGNEPDATVETEEPWMDDWMERRFIPPVELRESASHRA